MWKIIAALLLAGAALQPDPALSQAYPSRQIRVVVTFPAGGNADTVARFIADRLTQQMGQSVIVENRPGAASIVGTNAVVQAPADGYALLLAGTNLTTNPALGHKTPYDADRDLVPVVLMVTVPAVVVINPEIPATTLAEFIAHAKSRPGAINYGSAGVGSFPHLATERLAQETGMKVTHVPFAGFGPAMIGLLRNDISLLASDIPGALEHVRAGKLRALAVSGRARMPQLPDVPTISEAAVRDYDAVGFNGIVVRTGTPPAVIETLNREINRALQTAEMANHIAKFGLVAGGGTASDFAAFLHRDKANWSKVIAAGGIRVE